MGVVPGQWTVCTARALLRLLHSVCDYSSWSAVSVPQRPHDEKHVLLHSDHSVQALHDTPSGTEQLTVMICSNTSALH